MKNKEQISILNARKIYYLLFAKLFVFSDKCDRFDSVVEILNLIKEASLNEQSEQAIINLLQNFNAKEMADEYDDIFHAPPRPLHNTFSYYEEGYSIGSACVRVKKILAKTDIRRDENNFKENEDNIGFVFSLMSEFLTREVRGDESYKEYSFELFSATINPFIDEFILNLYNHDNVKIYKDVCVILQGFMEFERLFYALAKPVYKEEKNLKIENGISRSEALRRKTNKARKLAEQEQYG